MSRVQLGQDVCYQAGVVVLLVNAALINAQQLINILQILITQTAGSDHPAIEEEEILRGNRAK